MNLFDRGARALQIMPAGGWRAVLAGAEGEPVFVELVGWVLLEVPDSDYLRTGTLTEVHGLLLNGGDTHVDTPTRLEGFVGYASPADAPADWEGACAHLDHHRKR